MIPKKQTKMGKNLSIVNSFVVCGIKMLLLLYMHGNDFVTIQNALVEGIKGSQMWNIAFSRIEKT